MVIPNDGPMIQKPQRHDSLAQKNPNVPANNKQKRTRGIGKGSIPAVRGIMKPEIIAKRYGSFEYFEFILHFYQLEFT